MRARNIKPGFFKNEELVELSAHTRLLYIGLWCMADREGRLEDRPRRIKMEVLPADDYDIEAGLSDLNSTGMIARYEVDGVHYIEIPAFAKHQKPHHTEKKSELPPPNHCETRACSAEPAGVLREHNGEFTVKNTALTVNLQVHNGEYPPDSLNPDSLIPDSLNPDSLNPDSLNPDSLNPDSLNPDSLNPDSLNPDSLIPDSLNPDSLIPESKNPPDPPEQGGGGGVGQRVSVDVFEGHAFSPALRNTLESWIGYKAERRERYRPTGLRSLLKQVESKLSELSEEQIMLAITESMASNYRGIVWDRARQGRGAIRASPQQKSYDGEEDFLSL